jgi:hypothetical protein
MERVSGDDEACMVLSIHYEANVNRESVYVNGLIQKARQHSNPFKIVLERDRVH